MKNGISTIFLVGIIVMILIWIIPSYADHASDEPDILEYKEFTNSEFDISFRYPENYTIYTEPMILGNLINLALVEYENMDEGWSTSIFIGLDKDYFKKTDDDMKNITDKLIEERAFYCAIANLPECKYFEIFDTKIFTEDGFDSSTFVTTFSEEYFLGEYPSSDKVEINYYVHYGDHLLTFSADFPIEHIEYAQNISDFFGTIHLANEPLPISQVDFIENAVTSLSGTEIPKGVGTSYDAFADELDDALLLTLSKEYDEAIIIYDKILEIAPDNVAALSGKASVLNILGKYDEALAYFDKALEIEPSNLGALFGKEVVMKNLDKLEDAVEPEPVQNENEISSQPIVNADNGGGCLIATATFGSEFAPQVQQLREIRDNSLLQTESGRSFMESFNQFYYSFSPTIADLERENPVFKEVVKLTITPLLSSLSLLNYVDMDSEVEVLGYGISLILLNVGMYFVLPAIVIHRVRKFV